MDQLTAMTEQQIRINQSVFAEIDRGYPTVDRVLGLAVIIVGALDDRWLFEVEVIAAG
jgi:hypothetical protein